MALDSVSVSKQVASGKEERIKSPHKKGPQMEENAIPASPAKRNKCPGIRVVGGRIYDPVNGKTCHQCRQKTRDFAAACTNQRKNKPCSIMLCHKCLLNRYGENAEEVAALGQWTCPKCRGICNCSVCMKKKGQQPTGILINTAKATGFSSVSEMLLKGAGHVNREKVAVDMVKTPTKGIVISPQNRGKENSFDGKLDVNLPDMVNKKSSKAKEGREKRKTKQELIEGIDYKKRIVGETEESVMKSKKQKLAESCDVDNGNDKVSMETCVRGHQKKPKKIKSVGLEEQDTTEMKNITLSRRTSPRKLKNPDKMSKQELTEGADVSKMSGEETEESGSLAILKNAKKMNMAGSLEMSKDPDLNIGFNSEDKVNARKDGDTDIANCKNILKHHNTNLSANFPLPLGTELTSVAGIDVRAEDVGNALQFMEFFAVFGEVLGIKKGRPENVLRDILHGRRRRGKWSATDHFHTELLSILLREQGNECPTLSVSYGKNYWFDELKKCLSGYQTILRKEGLDLDKTADYETLDSSVKIRVLNLLCDELLETEMLRKWIDEQNTRFAENIKEAKQKVLVAKDKEKILKQKLKDDIAEAIIAKQGASLSISEHEAIVSHIKNEATKVHAEVLESMRMLPTDNRSCDAVRIEPIFMGQGGHAYWKLNYSGSSDLLHQDIGKGDTLMLNEKWFAIDVEGKEAIENHVSSFRRKRGRSSKIAHVQS